MVARDFKIWEEDLEPSLSKNLHVSCFYKFSEGALGSTGYFPSRDLLPAAVTAL